MTSSEHYYPTRNHELTLVFGVDASGKSTFLKNLSERYGSLALEPTSSLEAKSFKHTHANDVIDVGLVDEREAIFTSLNHVFDEQVSEALETNNVATSGSRLITALSHGAMRSIIGGPNFKTQDIVEEWVDSSSIKPQRIAFLHAPDEVIRKRIISRQLKGRTEERFWGFNSPYFLSQYQETLHEAYVSLLSSFVAVYSSLDTSQFSSQEIVEKFMRQ